MDRAGEIKCSHKVSQQRFAPQVALGARLRLSENDTRQAWAMDDCSKLSPLVMSLCQELSSTMTWSILQQYRRNLCGTPDRAAHNIIRSAEFEVITPGVLHVMGVNDVLIICN